MASSESRLEAYVMHQNLKFAGWFCTLIMTASTSWSADVGAVPKSAAGVSSDSATQAEVKAAFARFIAGQNAHDASIVSDVLVNSKGFVWAQYGGNSIWGFDEAMAAFKTAWKGSWHLDPQLNELRITRVAPGVAVLITPQLYTDGDPGEQPYTVPVRWGGVFVKTASGWRISAIFITPYPGWGKH
jgi:hypothetical protein